MIISPRPARLPVLWITCGLILLVAIEAFGQAGTARAAREPELLNSQRIERTFGSYGIEVLESDTRIRVSNLFSTEGGTASAARSRWSAIRDSIAPACAAEHAAIVARRLDRRRVRGERLDRREVPPALRTRSRNEQGRDADACRAGNRACDARLCARHREGRRALSSTPRSSRCIIPLISTTADLPVIYGPLPQGDVDADTTSMLDIAAAKMRGDR